MPAENGLRLHEEDGVLPVAEPAGEHDEQAAFPRTQRRTLRFARGYEELLAKGSVLGHQLVACAEEISNEARGQRSWAECLADRLRDRSEDAPGGGSDVGDERGEHCIGFDRRREMFKTCSGEILQRSCGGRAK
jgi:hypothetical protein